MDWIGLNADVERILTKHYTPGRNGSIKAVTIHHMGGNLSIDGCYSTWQTREASAHYAVQADGTIGQLVNDWDTAWACANAWANSNTISIRGRSTTPCSTRARTSWRRSAASTALAVRSGW